MLALIYRNLIIMQRGHGRVSRQAATKRAVPLATGANGQKGRNGLW